MRSPNRASAALQQTDGEKFARKRFPHRTATLMLVVQIAAGVVLGVLVLAWLEKWADTRRKNGGGLSALQSLNLFGTKSRRTSGRLAPGGAEFSDSLEPSNSSLTGEACPTHALAHQAPRDASIGGHALTGDMDPDCVALIESGKKLGVRRPDEDRRRWANSSEPTAVGRSGVRGPH
jgi:hypothetical protein